MGRGRKPGYKHSEETKAKMRAAHAARRAELRASVEESDVEDYLKRSAPSAIFRSVANGWKEWQLEDPDAPCWVEICDKKAAVRGLCNGHFYRLTRDPKGLRPEVPLRKQLPAGQSRHLSSDGYVYIKVPEGTPGRKAGGKMLEHRYVMQEYLGRPLHPKDTVHHKNGNRQDNRIENLELRVGPHGVGATEAHCHTCSCFDGAPK